MAPVWPDWVWQAALRQADDASRGGRVRRVLARPVWVAVADWLLLLVALWDAWRSRRRGGWPR